MVSLGGISRFGVRSLLTVIFLLAGANKVTELSFFPGVYDELVYYYNYFIITYKKVVFNHHYASHLP